MSNIILVSERAELEIFWERDRKTTQKLACLNSLKKGSYVWRELKMRHRHTVTAATILCLWAKCLTISMAREALFTLLRMETCRYKMCICLRSLECNALTATRCCRQQNAPESINYPCVCHNVISVMSECLSQVSLMSRMSPTWVSWCVWHAAPGGGRAAEVHQDHGGGALGHDDWAPTPPHPEHLLLSPRTLLAPPPLILAKLVTRSPAPSGSGARARLVPGASLLLLGQSLTPASFSRPEKIFNNEKIFCLSSAWCGHTILLSWIVTFKRLFLRLNFDMWLKKDGYLKCWIKDASLCKFKINWNNWNSFIQICCWMCCMY